MRDYTQLRDSTKALYDKVLSDINPKDYIQVLNARILANQPMGTILPLRAAIKYRLIEMGHAESDIDQQIAPVKFRQAIARDSLDENQIILFKSACASLPKHIQFILALMLTCGLRFGEVYNLTPDNFNPLGVELDKKRIIELNEEDRNWLSKLAIFPIPTISPAGLRKYTRALGSKYPSLDILSPECLRMTFMDKLILSGMPTEQVARIMGHKSPNQAYRRLSLLGFGAE